jgi:hypothetical protein
MLRSVSEILPLSCHGGMMPLAVMKRGKNLPPPSPAQPGGQRTLALGVTAGVHLAVIAAFLGLQFMPQPPAEEPDITAMQVSLNPAPEPPGAAQQDAQSSPMQDIMPLPVPQVAVPVITITRVMASSTSDLLSDSQLAGAARAGEGGGGGGCDTARMVQQVLRRDPRVRAALMESGRLGKASLLWNGDWVRSGGQEGKGLAVIRQAIIWKVAFEPEACRNARMQGLIVMSLDSGTRLAVGAGAWRWSDLLGLQSASLRR